MLHAIEKAGQPPGFFSSKNNIATFFYAVLKFCNGDRRDSDVAHFKIFKFVDDTRGALVHDVDTDIGVNQIFHRSPFDAVGLPVDCVRS